MITRYQTLIFVHDTAVNALRTAAKELKLDHLNINAKQKDVVKVKAELEKWADWHARKISAATERENRRRSRVGLAGSTFNTPPEEEDGTNKMSAPKVP